MAEMFEIIDDGTVRDAWLKARRIGIGASDAAGVLNQSPWSSPLAVYADKIGAQRDEPENERQRWGKLLEPVIAKEFGERMDRSVTMDGSLLRSTRWPFLTCTLDARQIVDPDFPWMPLEIKNTGEWWDGLPKHYWIQGQHQLAVTGKPWLSVAVLSRGSALHYADVQRDETFITGTLVPELEKFWDRVESKRPPAADASPGVRDALKALYPDDRGGTVALPADFDALDVQREEAVEEQKAADAKREEAENKIKAALGENQTGIVGSVIYTWKANKRGVRTLRRSESQ